MARLADLPCECRDLIVSHICADDARMQHFTALAVASADFAARIQPRLLYHSFWEMWPREMTDERFEMEVSLIVAVVARMKPTAIVKLAEKVHQLTVICSTGVWTNGPYNYVVAHAVARLAKVRHHQWSAEQLVDLHWACQPTVPSDYDTGYGRDGTLRGEANQLRALAMPFTSLQSSIDTAAVLRIYEESLDDGEICLFIRYYFDQHPPQHNGSAEDASRIERLAQAVASMPLDVELAAALIYDVAAIEMCNAPHTRLRATWALVRAWATHASFEQWDWTRRGRFLEDSLRKIAMDLATVHGTSIADVGRLGVLCADLALASNEVGDLVAHCAMAYQTRPGRRSTADVWSDAQRYGGRPQHLLRMWARKVDFPNSAQGNFVDHMSLPGFPDTYRWQANGRKCDAEEAADMLSDVAFELCYRLERDERDRNV